MALGRLVAGRDRPFQQPFDGHQPRPLLGVAEAHGGAGLAGAAGAADAMHVGLGLVRQFVVDHVGHVVHVDAPSGDVGRHEHRRLRRLERCERLLTLGLRLVAVDRGGVDAGLFEIPVEFVGAVLRPGKHDHPARRLLTQELHEQGLLLPLRHEHDRLGHRLGRRRSRCGPHLERAAEHRIGEVADLGGKRGGEEERLAVAGQLAHDLADVVNEAHVEHPVGLIEHQELDRADVDEPLADEIEQPAGRGHEHVHAVLHGAGLRLLADATVDHRRPQARVPAVGEKTLVDLGGEFAGGGEHEHAAPPGLGLPRRLPEAVDEGQGEGRRLAGAGLGAAEQVAAGEHVRDRLRLDRRGCGVALVGESPQESLRQAEVGEGRFEDGISGHGVVGRGHGDSL